MRKARRLRAREWGGGAVRGYIPQVEYTYDVIGHINEKQVSIVETTFDGRLELQNPDGLLDYFTMMYLGLERAATAREAIIIMTDLLQQYRVTEARVSLSPCVTKTRLLILEIIGKGPRCERCRVGSRPHPRRLHQRPCQSLTHTPVSAEGSQQLHVLQGCDFLARDKGYFSGKDEDFSFRDAYCPISFSKVRYADARVWSFFRHHCDPAEMDKYLPYINGDYSTYDHLPLYIKPDHQIIGARHHE